MKNLLTLLLILSTLGGIKANFINADANNYTTFLSALSPGDTLLLAPGNYTNRLNVFSIEGTAAAPIVIMGSGNTTVFLGNACCNTVSLKASAYVVLRDFKIDGQNVAYIDAIKAEGTSGNWTHHITIDHILIVNHGATQSTVGISTKCPSWDWIIRNCTIDAAGTGLYLGNSNGEDPFVNGLIENNLVMNTLGYNMQIKHQNVGSRDADGMTLNGKTIIRHNVFSKESNASSGGNVRPNVLVGNFPASGDGADDYYEIYGNFLWQNPSESLFQGTGNVHFYNNVCVNYAGGDGLTFQSHNGFQPRDIKVFHNTVVSNGSWGIRFLDTDAAYPKYIVGNAVFSDHATPIRVVGGGIASANVLDNAVDMMANANTYVNNAENDIANIDLYPLTGSTLNASLISDALFTNYTDFNTDFNLTERNWHYRGAYTSEGENPGWHLAIEINNTTTETPGIPLNTWQVFENATVGERSHFALNYIPSIDAYLFNLGTYYQNNSHPYPDMVYDEENQQWVNHLPDSLYGVWADSTGNTLVGNIFNDFYFEFKEAEGHLIPQLIHARQAAVHQQYALNTNDNKVYYYLNNYTFSYDPIQKKYEIYEPVTHPALTEEKAGVLKWSVMCYDPINDEVLLIGGAGIDAMGGRPGCWSFKMADKEWQNNENDIIPPARAYSNMVYDPSQQKILLFGGDHLDYLHSDTWQYDCLTKIWSQLSPEFSPSPRGGHLMCYSSKSDKIFLMGGYHYTSNTGYLAPMYWHLQDLDVWTFDWTSESWQFVTAFDYADPATPRPATFTPHYFTGAINGDDQLITLSDGTSPYHYKPKTYLINLDISTNDPANTELRGVAQGTIERRTGPYSPDYFDDGSAGLANDFYEQMPLDTWVRVPVGGNKYPESNRDWGTSVFDPERNLIYKWSGGHSAHCGNDVPLFDTETGHWQLPYYASFPLEYVYAGSPNPGFYSFNDRPFISTHTYDGYDFDVNLGQMVVMGNRYTRIFDAESGDWRPIKINNPDINLSVFDMSITSTVHGALFWTTRLDGSNNTSRIFLLNSESMAWDEILYDGPQLTRSYCDKAGAVYDSSRDRMLFATYLSADSTSLMAYNFEDNSTEILSPVQHEVAKGNQGLRESVYIPSLDIVFYQIDLNDSYKLIYDCENNSWDSLLINSSMDVNTTHSRSSGYMYDAQRNIIFDSETNCEVYALRLTGSYPDTVMTNIIEEDLQKSFSVNIYPNPTNDIINIDMPSNQVKTVDLYNYLGQKIFSKIQTNTFDLKTISNGVYYIKIERADGAIFIESISKE